MKRLAAVLAAAAFGTGCHSSGTTRCDPSTITLHWDFQRFDNLITNCAGAGVAEVDVFVNGAHVSTSPCSDGGVVIVTGSPGNDAFTVEGIDVAGRIAYRDEFTAQSIACGDRVVATTPAEGTANLNYAAPGGCPAGSAPCYLWFAVQDTVANVVAAAVSSTSPTSVKTSFPYPNDVIIRLPVGTFRLDFMQLVSFDFLSEGITCGPTNFSVAAALQTDVPANLACL